MRAVTAIVIDTKVKAGAKGTDKKIYKHSILVGMFIAEAEYRDILFSSQISKFCT